MTTLFSDTDDKNLERLFAEARKYPLLTLEQEQRADADKWGAIACLELVLLQESSARLLLCNKEVRSAYINHQDASFQ